MQKNIFEKGINWQNNIVENALEAHKQGKLKQAHDVYHSVLKTNPNHAQALHYLGLMAQQSGHSKDAIRLIEKSINILPNDIRAYNHLAQVYLSLGKVTKAKLLLEQGLELDPYHVDTLNNFANILMDKNDIHGAIKVYQQVIKLDSNASHSVFNLAQALKEVRQYKEALQWYLNTIAIEAKHLNAYHGAGITSEELGQFECAIKYYQLSLVNNPSHVRSMANLLSIKSFSPNEPLVNQALKILETGKLSPEDTAKLHNGLGKYFDSKALYDNAFLHFEKSSQAQKATSGSYNANFVRRFCDKIIQAYDKSYFTKLKSLKLSSASPIFIVGMPRSGTTLAEQILASHPDVFGAGELTLIPKLSKKYLGENHNELQKLTENTLQQAASSYITSVQQAEHSNEKYFTDKLPMNFMYLGFIASVFPNAKIIYCRRQPLDIGLSCFIEMFNLENDFSTDLNCFSQYFIEHHRIMQHWMKVLPIEIFDLKYEDLIEDQERQTSDLLNYVGLEWQNDCLNYYKTKRVVNTPSRWQVRQPIYQTSKQRWKNYQEHLIPLINHLQKESYIYK